MRARRSCSQKLWPILVLCSMERERSAGLRDGSRVGSRPGGERLLCYETDCSRSTWLQQLYPQCRLRSNCQAMGKWVCGDGPWAHHHAQESPG